LRITDLEDSTTSSVTLELHLCWIDKIVMHSKNNKRITNAFEIAFSHPCNTYRSHVNHFTQKVSTRLLFFPVIDATHFISRAAAST